MKNLPNIKLIVFDMDGVLVDVRASYLRAIKETVAYFCDRNISYSDIQTLKDEGGYNDDWDLTCELIKRTGVIARRRTVIEYFQSLYWGNKGDGFIRDEAWLLEPSVIEFLKKKPYILGIFTGRPRREAIYTLKLNSMFEHFTYIVGMEDVNLRKPNPEGLNRILSHFALSKDEALYVGDTIDDILAAKQAGVYPIAIASTSSIDFGNEGALAVLSGVGKLINIL